MMPLVVLLSSRGARLLDIPDDAPATVNVPEPRPAPFNTLPLPSVLPWRERLYVRADSYCYIEHESESGVRRT